MLFVTGDDNTNVQAKKPSVPVKKQAQKSSSSKDSSSEDETPTTPATKGNTYLLISMEYTDNCACINFIINKSLLHLSLIHI